jgi:eukaryotic-like serine/threonine-protein kinase
MMSSDFSSIDESARRRFEAAWADGAPVPIEEFLPASDGPKYLATLEELICIELEFAWRAAGAGGPLVEQYVQRFDALGDPEILLRLIEQESAVRHRFGDSPSTEEYRRRFPEIIVTGGELPTIAPRADAGGEASDRLAPGDETDRYRVDEEFARGGFGEILTVYDKSLQRTVALKQLSSKTTEASEFRRRFLNEARITAYLEHPGVVPVYQLHEPENREPYYTMKLVRGDTLAAAIEEFHRAKHTPSDHQVERARLLGAYLTVARTMAFAHNRGVIHRDLKPANIILGQYGETVVLDWGLAKRLDDAADDTPAGPSPEPWERMSLDVTQAGDVLGTPVYMSPEQASGAIAAMDQRCDVYAMGAILYEMLTGSRPFHGRSSQEVIQKVIGADLVSPRSVSADIPRPLEAICLKAMAADPDDRYPSSAELADDVERFLADQPIIAYRESAGERTSRWMRRHRTLGIAGIVSLVVVAAIAIAAALMINDQKTLAQAAETKAVAGEKKTHEALETARQALESARRSLYGTRIANAQHEWSAGYLSKADSLLADCDEDLRQWEWRYLKRLCNSHVRTIRNASGKILAAAFSPDGKRIAAGGVGGVSMWDGASDKLIWESQPRDDDVRRVLFSLDGSRIYALGAKLVGAYDAKSGKMLWELKEAHGMAFGWAVTPDDKYLMLFGRDQQLITINAVSGVVVNRSAKLGTIVSAIAYSPKDKRMALGFNMYGDVRVHQLGANGKTWKVQSGQRDVYDLAFSPDGKLVACAAGNPNTSAGAVRVWDCETGKLKYESIGKIDVVTKVAFSPSGKQIVTVGHDRRLTIWSMQSGKLVPSRIFRIRGGPIGDISLDNNNKRAMTVGDDGAARLWDLTIDQEYLQYGVKYRDMRGAAFGKDSSWFVDATSVARSTRSAEYLGDLIRGGATSSAGIAVSSDGRKFAIGSGRGTVGVWRPGEFPISVALIGHTGRTTTIAFSPDTETLVSGSDVDSDIRLWAIEEKKTIRTFGAKDRLTRCVRFSPDGKRILAVRRLKTRSNGARSYELKDWTLDGKPAGDWSLDGHEIYSFAFSADASLLATGDRNDGRVVVWNAETRSRITEIKGHGSGVSAIAFMPDGKRMVTAGIDRAVKLWNTETWTEVLTLDAGAEMDTLAISPDGNTIVVVDHYAHRARIWNADVPGRIKLGMPWRKVAMKELFPNMPRGPGLPPLDLPGGQPRDPHGPARRITIPGQNTGATYSPTSRPGAPVYVPGPDSSSDLP